MKYLDNKRLKAQFGLANKRNIKYFSAFLTLALACTFTMLLLYSKIEITVHNVYDNYTEVSQASHDITIHTLTSQQSLVALVYNIDGQNLDAITTQNIHHDNEIDQAFYLLDKAFEGDKSWVDTMKKLYLDWRSAREEIIGLFLKNEKRSALDSLLQQNIQRLTGLNNQLQQLTKTTDSQSKIFTNASDDGVLKSLQFELSIAVLLLSCLVAIFYIFQKRITNEKQAVSRALAWSNQLLDSSPDAMIISDIDGNISHVNKNAEGLFGYSKSEFKHLNISQLMPKRFVNHHQHIKHFFTSTSSREMGLGKTLYALNRLGQEFPVEISLNSAQLNEHKVAITVIRDVTEKKKNEAKLLHQANYDLLTNLPNRKLINDRLNQAINRAIRSNSKFGVLFIDLDDFKKANDLHGHEFGDKLLICVANLLKASLRAEDTIGRLGGDEYLVIIPDIIQNDSLTHIVKKILHGFKHIEPIDGKNIYIGASIGISIYPDNGINCDELIRDADLAMYKAKKTSGKSSFRYFDEAMLDQTTENYAIEIALQQALEKDEFYVVYQPKFAITSQKVIGFEALLRWNTPRFSHLTPEDYIPIIEKKNLINKVGNFVLKTSLEAIKNWQEMLDKDLHMAVNVSSYQLRNPTFASSIEMLLKMYRLHGRSLEIELTEQTLIEPTPMLNQALLSLRNIDVGIALDDFGTGYSSLHYLANYPITAIKIDKSFINGINNNNGNKIKTVLVDTIVALGQSLNLTVTAEGIELEEQIKYLRNINCDYGQGFYFSKPLTFEKISSLLIEET
jgi:diguanylate cyclase (GGDEF)-like protein/PAS domain S-box-containing protein